MTDFSRSPHTLVVSDIHLADAEPPHPDNPLWKRFKRPKHFIDKSFKAFLEHMQSRVDGESAGGPIELVLNGDIFDFDSVMSVPAEFRHDANWLERMRGLNAEEPKSRYKIKVILNDHSVWLEAIRNFILKGNRVVFVVGNHDMELQWPSVRQYIVQKLDLPGTFQDHVRFCEWFYVSNGDTLIEHGNQYDAYCLSANPINPLIKKGSRVSVRVPFGNLAGKYMLNGMGLMNPHADSSYIKSSLKEYVVFYYKYVMRTQPFLMWTWFWSALVTLAVSVAEGMLPAMTDPMTIGARVDDIAQRANASPGVVWSLKELHVHPAIFNPIKVARELWLDRALLFGLILFGSFQFFSFLRVFATVSLLWFVIPLALLLPVFMLYARSVESEQAKMQKTAFNMAPIAARIAKVKRVAQGHVHRERHTWVEGVEYLNTGTWSPAFHDVECTQPYGRKCFAWVHPAPSASNPERVAELLEWTDEKGPVIIPVE